MAIPTGTTARQLETTARWTLAGVVIVGMTAFWPVGYRTWGALSAGLLAVMGMWLIWRTVLADRTVQGHPAYLAGLVPVLVLVRHFAASGLGAGENQTQGLCGAIDLSMIFQFFLLGIGVMLTQSLLPRAAGHVPVLISCGAAMMGGSAAAIAWGQADSVRSSLALLGFGGIGVWLTALWGIGRQEAGFSPQSLRLRAWHGRPARENRQEASFTPQSLRLRELRLACVGVAIVFAAILSAAAPREALLAGGVLAATLILAAIIFHQHRKGVLLAGVILAAGVAAIVLAVRPELGILRKVPAGAFGHGEKAMAEITAHDSGVVVLGAATGWVGLMWLAGGMEICLVWLMGHARRGHRGDQARAILWTTATSLIVCSLLAPGGLFIPAVTLAAAFTLGLLPAMLGRAPKRFSGAYLLVATAIMMVLLGLARTGGMALFAARSFGANDTTLHAVAGVLLAMMLAWQMGSRNVWLGLAGIALSVVAGGLGELLQYVASPRSMQWSDFIAHAIGSAAVVIPYLLCLGARWCESPDAHAKTNIPQGA